MINANITYNLLKRRPFPNYKGILWSALMLFCFNIQGRIAFSQNTLTTQELSLFSKDLPHSRNSFTASPIFYPTVHLKPTTLLQNTLSTNTKDHNPWLKSLFLHPPYSNKPAYRDRHVLNIPTISLSALGMGYGFLALHNEDLQDFNTSIKKAARKNHPTFRTHVDNYLQFAPAATVVGLNLAGVHGRHNFLDEMVIYGCSSIFLIGSVSGIKYLTGELRPDGSAHNSFPSGHTATAFAAAEWLRMEYWGVSPWIGIAGYAAATSVGVLRIYNNRHWFSDVVTGAALGFLCTRVAYLLIPWIETKIIHPHGRQKIMKF